jgi:hypothetical protein
MASARATALPQAQRRGLDKVIAFAVGENIAFYPEPSAMWLECVVGHSICAL